MTRKNVDKTDNQQARKSKPPGKPYSVSEAIGKTARAALEARVAWMPHLSREAVLRPIYGA